MTEAAAPEVIALIQAALRCDLGEVARLVKDGADPNGTDEAGDTVLESVLSRLYRDSKIDRFAVIRFLLLQGADPGRLGRDGGNALLPALWEMDTEMFRLLLDAGADPNIEGEPGVESLYDLAEFDYRYEVWDLNTPENDRPVGRSDPDAWLLWLDRIAEAHGKRRPRHLFLLRERGAKTRTELEALGRWQRR